ncbi:condensation domain-containing protein [Pseudomassariella vexata]|uniref:Condensation domain-domain-containing protein n=1 Tax=Pseudomassariella vexata TaxID=1141098 RepID=A0A1Y2D9G1_9PEZI|nr:condensation domain-containing protein [Pseudomassariella vexata]ORY55903.1 condensation domain-domain-containing protein [Pseudomassariella vexata]
MAQQRDDVMAAAVVGNSNEEGQRKQSFLVRLPSRTTPTANADGGTAAYPVTPMQTGAPTPFGSTAGTPLYETEQVPSQNQTQNSNNARPEGPGRQQTTSVESLVSRWDRQKAVARLGVHDSSVEAVMPALPGQEFHLASWLMSGRTLAEPTWAFATKKPVDEHRLRAAWAALRRRHASMRSTLVAVRPDEAVTVVLRQASGASNYATFSKVSFSPSQTLEERVKAQLEKLARQPSSLETPPVRLTLVCGNASEGDAVLITIHHAACDTRSMGLLVQELMTLYQGKPVLTKAPSFRNFVKETLSTHDREAEEHFWKETLRDCQETIVQPETTDIDDTHIMKTEILVRGTKASIAAVDKAAASVRVSPDAIIYLAFTRILAERTGSKHPVFGCFHSGRGSIDSIENIESLVGPCSTMLPTTVPSGVDVSSEYCQDKSSKSNLIHALESVQELLDAELPYEQSRLRDVLRWAGLGQNESESVPFNTYLNILWDHKLQGSPPSHADQPGDWERMDLGVRTDYSAAAAIPGRTTVDNLDTSAVMRHHNVLVDVGCDQDAGVLEIRLRADEVLMGVDKLTVLAQAIDDEVAGLVDCLSC